jgi:hypothetical protein
MTTEDIIIAIFCCVDEPMPNLPKHRQARLSASELVPIGLLVAVKGGYFRAFDRWLRRDDAHLFGGLPNVPACIGCWWPIRSGVSRSWPRPASLR